MEHPTELAHLEVMADMPSGAWIAPGERGVRLADAPAVTLVVASGQDQDPCHSFIEEVRAVCVRHGVEVVVARAGTIKEIEELERTYPDIRFAGAPVGTTIPTLRSVGMSVAGGDVVVFTDDHRVPPADWIARLVASPPSRRGAADLNDGSSE